MSMPPKSRDGIPNPLSWRGEAARGEVGTAGRDCQGRTRWWQKNFLQSSVPLQMPFMWNMCEGTAERGRGA